jgi:hypothetical protein
MVGRVLNVSTGSSVGGSILLPNALQVEFSSIGENDGGIDGLVGLLLGLSLYVSSIYAERERREREGDLQLSQPWTHRSFGAVRGKTIVRWQTSDGQLRVGDKEVRTYCCYVL